ncbi:MAG: RNA methyltransferase [Prevotella sp.]|jgi:TrmH family RNA methyltransferase|nr:RNA methyltransferase [Prevotella sp.]
MEFISSLQNPKIKNIVRLAKHKERLEQQAFIIEGARELSLALAGGYAIHSVFVCPSIFASSDYPDVLNELPESLQYEVSENVFKKIAYRENSDGLLALAVPKKHSPDDLHLPDNPFVIVLEAVEKPGNLGAILRTADAAAADAVIVCEPLADLYNPNVVRASVGCLFTVQTAVCTSEEALNWLKARNICSFAAELEASIPYQEANFRQASAIIMGTEADGLTPFWLKNADVRIKIPMRGKIDSLNVSVSTAVLTFEAMRQRGFEKLRPH